MKRERKSKILVLTIILIGLAIGQSASAQVTQEWVRRYNTTGTYNDEATVLFMDPRGNVYVTGGSYTSETNCDYATVKYDADGNQLWVATYDGNDFDYATALFVDPQGNVYVTGESIGSGTNYDYATVKYDADGKELWVARYDGANSFDYATALFVDPRGNVYVTGGSIGSGTNYDYATVKYDADGKELWVARYDGPANSFDYPTVLFVDPRGNVYVTGASYTTTTECDYATVKYTQD